MGESPKELSLLEASPELKLSGKSPPKFTSSADCPRRQIYID